MYNKSFIEDYLHGDATLSDLDNYIEYWHSHETGNTLQEFLGMTDYEYEQWLYAADAIVNIIQCRRHGIDFFEYKSALATAYKEFPPSKSYRNSPDECDHDFSFVIYCDGGTFDIARCRLCGTEKLTNCTFDEDYD